MMQEENVIQVNFIFGSSGGLGNVKLELSAKHSLQSKQELFSAHWVKYKKNKDYLER